MQIHRPQPLTDADVDDLLAIGFNLIREHTEMLLSAVVSDQNSIDDVFHHRLCMAGFVMAHIWDPAPRQHRRWAPEVAPAAGALYIADRFAAAYLLTVKPGVLSDLLDALIPDPSLAQLLPPAPTCNNRRHHARWARRSIALIRGVDA